VALVGQQILDEGPRRDRSGRNPARNIGEEHRGRRDQGVADGQLDAAASLLRLSADGFRDGRPSSVIE